MLTENSIIQIHGIIRTTQVVVPPPLVLVPLSVLVVDRNAWNSSCIINLTLLALICNIYVFFILIYMSPA